MNRSAPILICAFLLLATLAVYWPVQNFDFVNIDDDLYVTNNPRVQEGFSAENIAWAFTNNQVSLWIPLVWLSYMLDSQLAGFIPKVYHLTNLILHITNALLLFLILKRMTGALWRSAFVAALFALHPVRVESVAWVTERKDVLSTLFFLLTLWAYFNFTKNRSIKRYLWVVAFFALGLMTKPMLVTLPFVLLLLDYWPLKQTRFNPKSDAARTASAPDRVPSGKPSLPGLISEKIPLFFMSAALSFITYIFAQGEHSVISFESLPMEIRVINALVAYMVYIKMMIWPSHLAVFYPHPGAGLLMWKWIASGAGLLGISMLALWLTRRAPYLIVGWCWFLGLLFPAIGIVQVGEQAYGDRYTYIAHIGLFIAVSWGASRLLASWRHGKIILGAASSILLVILALVSVHQLSHWKNNLTLFEHTVRVTENNYFAQYNLGFTYNAVGDFEKAAHQYREALKIHPNPLEVKTLTNLGNTLTAMQKADEALDCYEKVLALAPDEKSAHYNLGNAYLFLKGDIEKAIHHFMENIRCGYGDEATYNNLGIAMIRKGDYQTAVSYLKKAVEFNSGSGGPYCNLGIALANQNRSDEAIECFKTAIKVQPEAPEGYLYLANMWLVQRRFDELIAFLSEAIEKQPGLAEVHNLLGYALLCKGSFPEAEAQFNQALAIKPDFEEARRNLNLVLQQKKR
ncbi:MAG: tetratricopeptide repeat protein [Planctomycetes bacterium]|nr:tetratricopeptide repeat protein [Planctomycetota bacterium]